MLPGLWAAELASVACLRRLCSVMAGGTARLAAAEGEAGHEPGTGCGQPPAPLSFEHTRPFLHAWFEREAEQREVARDELHRLSGWSYLSTAEFRSLVADAVHRLNPPIRDGAFVYELGIGAGAVLKTISSLHRIRPAGCDFSPKAIQRASEIFPAHAAAFRVGDIALPLSSKGGCAARAGAYSHVLSFGSLAMYLTHSEMAVALRNVAKLASAGGSVAVTHFIEADGEPKGTIVAPISRQRLRQLASAAGLTNISFHPMKYQGDRFMMTARGLKGCGPWALGRLRLKRLKTCHGKF
ncbi:hypothetical protein EMIHUDRAFT_115005 [Emiliania huxleyi CCMP1516]|uniref:Methyltransferase domain-containing protein n=2 Tax=Emiliania huxleyi TaxID=2903 RepID=A0A0D3JT58_EMIH1|nr:hypothetical protein EMIHUDRAFT_115005 [Emiliania huxleyi CCMP1516]EOD26693.1 hypothetical protein EMIHUDRAFT_115005 [Emiliania huxleyi CCMP1516]|eukprot:XP_005779122.1 hypothetical protein EMIHUDRAFT_115005 [Emiliania huxleyi CCMP1516]